MGYIKHDAIIVTDWTKASVAEAVAVARSLGCSVLGPSEEGINGHSTMIVCPDGCKEGWHDSAAGDWRRERFIEYLRTTFFQWVAIEYGHDPYSAKVVDSAWH